ncbi:MAG TPA: Asp-tRNA(Asn)/Glu-tRNA(Gln) amidotransferase subunit GatB [Candidatus Saccharimonadales bacterium]|nr:Asp-tRNA(Asn)/Glu-tRNA(Gln) amidotransferase subunit GatB [Candidatus Saccharimonadales bacterium]
MPADKNESHKYQPTIGIECHVQLKTKTKLFSAVGNDARTAAPNSLISHIDIGMPGALPVLNAKAIELAGRAAFALNTQPQRFSKFDRKHYFYPDLPKGYQITQYEDPIIKGGSVEINVDGNPKTIRITRVHLEEDAGKNTHPAGADYSLVDLNRAGTPLLEIVSEPDISSPAEAKAFARELYLLMKYAGVSDVDLYHGNMRFDVNVSVSPAPGKLGKRAEVKNLNSFRSVENAVAYEIKRQSELYQKGATVDQETRGWDEAKQKTTSQRGKEEAHDYRYMPEPDIPPIELDQQFIDKIKAEMPKLPNDYRNSFRKLDIDTKSIEDIISVPDMAKTVEEVKDKYGHALARRIAFWLHWKTGIYEEDGSIKPAPVATLIGLDRMVELAKMVETNELSSTAAKDVFYEMINDQGSPRAIAEKKNLLQMSDKTELEKIVAEVLSQNQKAAEDVKNGEMKAIGFLVGQVMAKSQGKANPQIAQELIKKQLGL